MPGLSTDPDKAQRQLDGLAKGRVTQARALLGIPDGGPPAAATPPPAGPRVHRYDDPPEAPPHVDPSAAADPEPEPQPAAQRRRGGFLEGLRVGLLE